MKVMWERSYIWNPIFPLQITVYTGNVLHFPEQHKNHVRNAIYLKFYISREISLATNNTPYWIYNVGRQLFWLISMGEDITEIDIFGISWEVFDILTLIKPLHYTRAWNDYYFGKTLITDSFNNCDWHHFEAHPILG